MTSFITGFALMTVELLASRIVAPIIGSSVFTWTSVIGTTLLGLSIGSYLGGKLSDKFNNNWLLPLSFLVSSISVFLINFFAKSVGFIINSTDSMLLINLFVSLYLFLPSALFIGTIQPIVLKKYADNISNIGKEYGLLSSLWSLGSILGVFLSGFYFVSNIGSFETLNMISIILLILSIAFSYKNKRSLTLNLVILLIFLTIIFLIPKVNQKNNKILFEKETNYYKIRIVDRNLPKYGDTRFLFLDIDSHNEIAKDADIDSYTKIYPIFSDINADMQKMLVIGAGAYEIPQYLKENYKNSDITVLEVDPEIEKVGEMFFDLKPKEIKTKITDARVFFSKTSQKYDLIFGDAYNSFISVPWYLLTDQFNKEVYEKLTENGIYALNFIGKIEGNGSELTKSIATTFKKTFKNSLILKYGNLDNSVQNIVLIGIKGEVEINSIINKITRNHPSLAEKILSKEKTDELTSSGQILTDNFSPIEKLISPITQEYFTEYIRFLEKLKI
jgi:spermidine synthase